MPDVQLGCQGNKRYRRRDVEMLYHNVIRLDEHDRPRERSERRKVGFFDNRVDEA